MSLAVATYVMAVGGDNNSNSKLTTLIKLEKLKAFPTAEGAGAESSGGRKGDIIYVTNRRATGDGSLQQALQTEGNRTILFAIGGKFNIDNGINLGSKRGNRNSYRYSNFTLAGQTANDKGGVHLASKYSDSLTSARHFNVYNQENMILRYFDSRFNWQWYLRSGNTKATKQSNEPSIRFSFVNNLIIDHITSGWSSYGLIILSGGSRDKEKALGNITIQRSLMHENIIKGDNNISNKEHYNHNVGMLLGKDPGRWVWDKETKTSHWHSGMTKEVWDDLGEFSVHKNAFIGVSHRFPNTSGGEGGRFRITNNYIYGFRGDSTGERLARFAGTSQNDLIGNVYQLSLYSPNFTTKNLYGYLNNETFDGHISKANFYVKNNLFLNNDESVHDVSSRINADSYLMLHDRRGGSNKNNRGDNLNQDNSILRSEPIPKNTHPVSILDAKDVKKNILNNVGGNVKFHDDGTPYVEDEIDNRYLTWARENSGPDKLTKAKSHGGIGDGGLGDAHQFNYPTTNDYNDDTTQDIDPKTFDSDLDGIPDEWEGDHKLTVGVKDNNNVREDRDWKFDKYLVRNTAGYTNLEMYLADIAGDFHMLAKTEGTPINNHKESIKISSMPTTIVPASNVEAWLNYSANGKRIVKCYLKNGDTNKVIAFDKRSVTAGSDVPTTCDLSIPANIISGNNYLLYTYITKANGKWSERFDEATQKNIKISALTDDITGISIPHVIKVGDNELTSYITYSAKDTRDIKCYLKNKAGKVIGFDVKSVTAGVGTIEELDGVVTNPGKSAECTFTFPNNISEGDYSIYTYITKSHGKWSQRFDEMTRPIKIEK